MKLPALHNFNAIKGEVISLKIGYNNVVASENLFACVRKYANSEDYKAKFNIEVSEDDLQQGEICKIALHLDTSVLDIGKYQWDLFLWVGENPVKCLVKGLIDIINGVSNRGK